MRTFFLALVCCSCATTQMATAPKATVSRPVEPPAAVAQLATIKPLTLVVSPTQGTPIVSVRLVFRAGSVDDPSGKSGLTALTTRLLVEGGTTKLSSAALQDALFPMAAELDSDTDKELTVISGRVHRERLAPFLEILTDTLLSPRLDPREFDRLKTEQLNAIRNRLRNENDEELGKVVLDSLLFRGHPYAHATVGTERGLEAITLDDVRTHWKQRFTQARLVIGLAGAVDEALGASLQKTLAQLPATGAEVVVIPPAPTVENETLIVQRDTASTAGSFGLSWKLRRSDPDFALVFLAASYLGEHRQEHGVLFRELRDRRGLNYGTYAYAEHFRQDGWVSRPRPNVLRAAQDFTLWLRPVEAANGLFATRGALYFLEQTLKAPLPAERFETARGFLLGATRQWTLTDQLRLGWAIDELLSGSPGHLDRLRQTISSATPDTVQAALRKRLDARRLNFVFVTKDATALNAGLTSSAPSPITYSTPKPPDVLTQDEQIAKHPLPMRPDQVSIIEASSVMR